MTEQGLCDFEKAKRGVVACLASELMITRGRYDGEPKTFCGERDIIGRLAHRMLVIRKLTTDPNRIHTNPSIIGSEIYAALGEQQRARVPNPFYSTEEDVVRALREMLDEGLISCVEDSARNVTKYSLTTEGIEYLKLYDAALGQKVVNRLAGKPLDEIRGTGKPWEPLMPMANKYAETMFPDDDKPKSRDR
jgi:hypothetical protein